SRRRPSDWRTSTRTGERGPERRGRCDGSLRARMPHSAEPPATVASSLAHQQRTSRYEPSADLRAADRDLVDLVGRAADTDGDALAVFAARPDAVGKLEVVAEHRHLPQHVGAVADEVHALERRGDFAVFDEVALGEREDEVAVRDVDLTAAELLGE